MLVFHGITWTVLAMLLVTSAQQDIYVEPNTRSLTVWQGHFQEVVCYIISSKTAVDLTWAKDPPQGRRYTVMNETTANNEGSFKISRILTFQSFNINDAGTYTCTWRLDQSAASQWQIKLHFQKRCDPGMYDIGCTKNCSSHCKKTNRKPGICDYTDGACLDGCQSGYIGFNCTAVCAYGYYGPDCIHACSEHCKEIGSDTSPCQQVNGTCLAGCKPGYKGALCTTAAASESGPSTGVIVGSIFVVFVMIVIGILIYHYRRKIWSVCGWSKADPERERFNPTSDSTTAFASPPTIPPTTTAPATTTTSLDVHQVWTQQSTAATTAASTIVPIAAVQTYTIPALNPGPICTSGDTRPAAQINVFRGSTVDSRFDSVAGASSADGGAACLDDSELTRQLLFDGIEDIINEKSEDELREMKSKLNDLERDVEELKAESEGPKRKKQDYQDKVIEAQDHHIKTLQATIEEQQKNITEGKEKCAALARQISERHTSEINRLTERIDKLEERLEKRENMLKNEGSESDSGEYLAILKKEHRDLAAFIKELNDDVKRKERENEELKRIYDQDSSKKAKSRSEISSELDDRTDAARSSSARPIAGAGHDAQNLDGLQGASTLKVRKYTSE